MKISTIMALLLFIWACFTEVYANTNEAKATNTKATNKNNPAYFSGGKTTVFNTSHNAFSLPARNLGILRRDSFFIGNAFFKQPWVSSPASTTARDGLGPLFNINTCQGCHIKDGRGRPPLTADEPFKSALVRLSIPIEDPTNENQKNELLKNGAIAEPSYGGQLQNHAIQGLKNEGTPKLEYTEISGMFSDGETYRLQKPTVKITDLNYGELHKETLFSVQASLIRSGMLNKRKQYSVDSVGKQINRMLNSKVRALFLVIWG